MQQRTVHGHRVRTLCQSPTPVSCTVQGRAIGAPAVPAVVPFSAGDEAVSAYCSGTPPKPRMILCAIHCGSSHGSSAVSTQQEPLQLTQVQPCPSHNSASQSLWALAAELLTLATYPRFKLYTWHGGSKPGWRAAGLWLRPVAAA